MLGINTTAISFNSNDLKFTFPNDLKVAKVSPVFKTGDRKDRSMMAYFCASCCFKNVRKASFFTNIRIFYEGKYVF